MINRCSWCEKEEIYTLYHDTEWGVPVHDDRNWFEFLVLEGMQAGLSWITVLKKRESFRNAFDHFDVQKVANYDNEKLQKLLKDTSIIRNKRKIEAAISNAKEFIKIQEEFGSFDKYIWQFVGYKPIINKRQSVSEIPATSPESDVMSKDLIKRGFKFVGTTICYAMMQAAGMVNDHIIDCFRYDEIKKLAQ